MKLDLFASPFRDGGADEGFGRAAVEHIAPTKTAQLVIDTASIRTHARDEVCVRSISQGTFL